MSTVAQVQSNSAQFFDIFLEPFKQGYYNILNAIEGKRVETIASSAMAAATTRGVPLSLKERVETFVIGALLLTPIINAIVRKVLINNQSFFLHTPVRPNTPAPNQQTTISGSVPIAPLLDSHTLVGPNGPMATPIREDARAFNSSHFETLKRIFSRSLSTNIERMAPTQRLYLEKYPLDQGIWDVANNVFQGLSEQQKGSVYGKVWELAKMNDPSIKGGRWGEENAFSDRPRFIAAMHGLGLLGDEQSRCSLTSLCHEIGEGGLGAQYFSLSEYLGRDPLPGRIGYVNGMGVPALELAGRDAKTFSDMFANGSNIHAVYNSTHQAVSQGDAEGFGADLLRLQAINGGSYTRTSYLIAQQIIDFLNKNPNKNWLQIAHSEGAAHVNAALRLIQASRADLFPRIRVITLCPAYFIDPSCYPGTQIVNLVKSEDWAIYPWAHNASDLGSCSHILTVPHTGGDPHNPFVEDYRRVAKPLVEHFMLDGNIV